MEFLTALGGSLLASVLAIIGTLAVNKTGHPRLLFAIEAKPPEMPPVDNKTKFLRVEVRNSPSIPRYLRWAIRPQTAVSCTAAIRFLRDDGVSYIDRNMVGRWASTPGPEIRDMYRGEAESLGLDPELNYSVVDRSASQDALDIQPGATETLDLVYRKQNAEQCAGWNNRIILVSNPPAQDVFIIPRGLFLAEVRVSTGGTVFSRKFRIHNDVRWDDFRLDDEGLN